MNVGCSHLGKPSPYPERYDRSLLCAISRSTGRKALEIDSFPPFFGVDLWTGYELSWIGENGVPQVAIGRFQVPVDSPNFIESKSLKLYLNSFNQTHFPSWETVRNTIERDLTCRCKKGVGVKLTSLKEAVKEPVKSFSGICLDDQPLSVNTYQLDPNILRCENKSAEESLFSHLLRSTCPVTGQPDWGSIQIAYRGPKINHASLLRYLISFRTHQEFHEHCIERIFTDLKKTCRPTELTVFGKYTRRGGIEINPFRTSVHNTSPPLFREVRQ